jgi:tetratricopeptide (TPR) repeat protein
MPTRNQAYLRHATHYWALLAVSQDVYKLGGTKVMSALSLLDSEWSNIQISQRWAEGHMNHDEVSSSLCIAFALNGGDLLDIRLSNSEHVHWLEVGLTAARQSGNRKLEGILLGEMGLYRNLTGDKQEGISCELRSLQILREVGSRRLEATMLGRLGQSYAGIGNYELALEFLENYLKLSRELGSLQDEGGALGSLGVMYAWMGDSERAISYSKKYLRIARKLGDVRGQAFALGNLARSYADLGDDSNAIETYQQQLAIARELDDPYNKGNSLLNLSVLFGKQDRYDLAVPLAEDAVRSYERIKHGCYYRAINHLLALCQKEGVSARENR